MTFTSTLMDSNASTIYRRVEDTLCVVTHNFLDTLFHALFAKFNRHHHLFFTLWARPCKLLVLRSLKKISRHCFFLNFWSNYIIIYINIIIRIMLLNFSSFHLDFSILLLQRKDASLSTFRKLWYTLRTHE